MYLYVIIGILIVIIILLIIKLYIIKKSAREITEDYIKKVKTNTNTQLRISSHDKDMQNLANSINSDLKEMRAERLKYESGNTELKKAITNVSHDIRTPLTAIYGYLDMLEKTSDEAKKQEYIKIMKERANMMKALTEELFNYSVLVSNEDILADEEVYINKLLEESIVSFYPELNRKGIEPVINITSNKIVRLVNKDALTRVFSNIINNACKYSDGDLKIELSDEGIITFSNKASKLTTVEVEQLFNRFYTVEVARHSTGLGLSIAKTFIEKMGGKIDAHLVDGNLVIRIELLKKED